MSQDETIRAIRRLCTQALSKKDCRSVEEELTVNKIASKVIMSVLKEEVKKGSGDTLMKKANLIFWPERHIRFEEETLVYHKGDSVDSPESGFLCFRNQEFQVRPMMSGKDMNYFVVQAVLPDGNLHDEEISFKAATPEKTARALQKVAEMIERSTGKKRRRRYLSTIPKFWKSRSVHATELEADADSCDAVLFNVDRSIAQVLRVLTNSDCDHVGLTLKNSQGQLLLVDSTGGEGVGYMRWRAFLKYKAYEYVNTLKVRRLQLHPRPEQFYERLEFIINATMGCRYQLSFDKLFRQHSVACLPAASLSEFEESMKRVKESGRSFFCSEFVAFVYKHLGLLPGDVDSASYWPGSFSCHRELNWLSGARLGDEEIICFDPEECQQYCDPGTRKCSIMQYLLPA